jgi:hypothetical protein
MVLPLAPRWLSAMEQEWVRPLAALPPITTTPSTRTSHC